MTQFSTTYQPENEAKAKPKKSKRCRDALMLALEREVQAADGQMTKRIVQIAEALCKKAADGDVQAIKEIYDRVDGKVAQQIEHTGEDGGPVLTGITVTFVKPE